MNDPSTLGAIAAEIGDGQKMLYFSFFFFRGGAGKFFEFLNVLRFSPRLFPWLGFSGAHLIFNFGP